MSDDLFASTSAVPGNYDASSIEVLEGLEPVRRRPGMYIGGTDERAFHHLAAEVLDNAMDEAVAGHANRIEILLEPGNRLTITDNGRGIPVDPHPKFPDKSALEVILSTLHSGGKFNGKAYATSGGLHGVGVSVVNALSSDTVVEVARNKELFRQRFSRGLTLGPIEKLGPVNNRRGTSVAFTPDTEIFGEMNFKPARLFRLARSLPASKSAGNARLNSSLMTHRPKPFSSFPAALPTICASKWVTANASRQTSLRVIRTFRKNRVASNGPCLGRFGQKAATAIIATPSRHPMAARMKQGFARPS